MLLSCKFCRCFVSCPVCQLADHPGLRRGKANLVPKLVNQFCASLEGFRRPIGAELLAGVILAEGSRGTIAVISSAPSTFLQSLLDTFFVPQADQSMSLVPRPLLIPHPAPFSLFRSVTPLMRPDAINVSPCLLALSVLQQRPLR